MNNSYGARSLLLSFFSLFLASSFVFTAAMPTSIQAKWQEQSPSFALTSGGQWITEPVTSNGTTVFGRSLIMDSRGIPHIAYVTPDQVLHYSTWDGAAWTNEAVNTQVVPASPVILFDPAGVLHIVYMKSGPSVWYATRSGSLWNSDIVEDGAIDPWLAFDSAGHPHVVFQDVHPLPPAGGGLGLVHTTNSGTGWVEETVVARDCSTGCGPLNIAVDSSDKIHISYPQGNAIRYAYKDGGVWNTEEVTSSGLNPWLAVDRSGNPKVAYTFPNPDVMLASRGVSTWTTTLVDGEVVADPSLALDRYDNPHMTYCDARPIPPDGPGLGLKYAYMSENGWVIEEVDGMVACSGVWLALDKMGSPSILYYDNTNQRLKYAHWTTTPANGTIPTGGGSLTSSTDQAGYTFPLNTFSEAVTVTHTPLFPGSIPPTDDLQGIGHNFAVNAVYVSSGDPAQPAPGKTYSMSVQYTNQEKGVIDESTLALYYWDGSKWVREVSSQVDTTTNTVSATPNHFSVWAVMGETNSVFLPIVKR